MIHARQKCQRNIKYLFYSLAELQSCRSMRYVEEKRVSYETRPGRFMVA